MSSTMDRLKKRASETQKGSESEVLIPLDKLRFDPTQPRKAFHTLDGRVAEKDQAYIAELAATINEHGLVQAITVQEQGDGTYLVVVGECRTRAHLLLGLTTIRATVRNDLINQWQRLMYQIAENVNRQDLSDEELALSIKLLLESGNDGKPMSQVAIANKFGKSEGWVTRFVRYGDDEQQRVWVKSGIADSVENVYRLSLLPKTMQMDILARVELPEGHPQRIEKPLSRIVIDEFSQEAKYAKARDRAGITESSVVQSASNNSATPNYSADVDQSEQTPSGRVIGNNAIDLALQEALLAGQEADAKGSVDVSDSSPSVVSSGYALSEEARLALLSDATVDMKYGSAMSSDDINQSPVHCRVSVRNMEALLKLLEEDQGTLDSARSIRCDLIIPGVLAGKIANHLAGVIVDEQEVPSVVQSGLVKLA